MKLSRMVLTFMTSLCIGVGGFTQLVSAAPVSPMMQYLTTDSLKNNVRLTFTLKLSNGNTNTYVTGDDPGMLMVNEAAGTMSFVDRIQNSAGDSGFDLEFHWKIVDFSSLGLSAPRCWNDNCSALYYTNNGINPKDDWIFFESDTTMNNGLTGWGKNLGDNRALTTKWGQFGDGAGGIHVKPEGLALGAWLNDYKGDLNVNVQPVPTPTSWLLFGSGLVALVGWQRFKRFSYGKI